MSPTIPSIDALQRVVEVAPLQPTKSKKEEEAYETAKNYWTQLEEHFKGRQKPTGVAEHQYRKTDILVTSFPKAGTTLMQFISYQIAVFSGGGPTFDKTGLNFPDLYVVSPWLDFIPQIGLPVYEMHPRVFKTHVPVSSFTPHVAKHIVVIRNPVTYPSSFLDFMIEAIVPETASASEDVRRALFDHCSCANLITPVASSKGEFNDPHPSVGKWHAFILNSIFPLRENVHIIFYEDLMANFVETVRRLAAFMECPLSTESIEEIARRCDRNVMAKDKRFCCKIECEAFGIKTLVSKAKPIHTAGFKRFRVSHEVAQRIEEMNLAAFGVQTYDEFKQLITKKQWEAYRR